MEASGIGGPMLGVVLAPGLLAAGVGSLIFIGLDTLTGLGTFSLAIPDAPSFTTPTVLEFASRPRVWYQTSLPIRYGRVLVSPFTFYRGVANLMAPDLATTPASGLRVQLCGDAHLSNFGGFGSPDRELVFDINDGAVGRAVAIAECSLVADRASHRRRIVPRRSNTSGARTAESIKTG